LFRNRGRVLRAYDGKPAAQIDATPAMVVAAASKYQKGGGYCVNQSHISIELEGPGGIDTHHWVFCGSATSHMLICMGSRSRFLLVVCLSGLLILTGVTGAAGLVMLWRIQVGENALRARFVERSGALERLRDSITLSSALARDYFTEPQGAAAISISAK